MDEVSIYIMQSLEGPRAGEGDYVYLLQKEGNDKTLVDFGKEETTAHGLEVMALIAAFKRLRRPCILRIHSAHGWIQQIFNNDWMTKWQQADWKNSKGKEVANATQLRELSAILENGQHKITSIDSDFGEYKSWLEFALENRREN